MITAERVVAHPPERVFEFLSDLRNHWRLQQRAYVELDRVAADGGVIRLRGPLGLSRRVETRVLEADRPHRVAGRADLRGGTVGLVAWELAPEGDGTRVRLSADVASASPVDRILLALGGRAWLARLFGRTLANLDRVL